MENKNCEITTIDISENENNSFIDANAKSLIVEEDITDLLGLECLEYLEELSIVDANLSFLEIGNNTELRILRLSNNLFTKMEDIEGIEETNIKELYLDNNQLEDFQFHETNTIERMSLANNFMTLETLPRMLWLRYLDISGNQIQENLVFDCTNLETLIMNNCSLESIPNMSNLRRLKVFSAQYNDIGKIQNIKYPLEELYLDGNSISSIPYLPSSLKILTLNNNNIVYLDYDILVESGLEQLEIASDYESLNQSVYDIIPYFRFNVVV